METTMTPNTNDRSVSNGRLLRLLMLTMSLAMLTFCLALGTVARYSTSTGITDSARVAKFGVTITASDNSSFDTQYTAEDGTITVKSSTADKVVAPGTADGGIRFTISGTPEVRTRLIIETEVMDDIFYKYDPEDTYRPVIFKLRSDREGLIDQGSLTEICDTLNAHVSEFAPNEAIDDVYTLSWEWAYHVTNKTDELDTVLGDIAAGINTSYTEGVDYSLDVAYAITITIYQITE